MNFDSFEILRFQRRGRVMTITLNAPKTRNAIDHKMHQELIRVFTEADDDPDSDVLVITGEGAHFSGGGDMGWMREMLADPREMEIANTEGRRLINNLVDCQKPVIAKLRGSVIGQAVTLALLCDIVFAADDATICDPHVLVGIVAADGSAAVWPHLVGHARAKEYLLTGDPITAVEAERIGLINHAVPADELDARVDAFADRLAGGASMAIKWTKRAINAGLKPRLHDVVELGFAYGLTTGRSSDHREAVNAFAERRRPQFTGR